MKLVNARALALACRPAGKSAHRSIAGSDQSCSQQNEERHQRVPGHGFEYGSHYRITIQLSGSLRWNPSRHEPAPRSAARVAQCRGGASTTTVAVIPALITIPFGTSSM